MSLSISLVAFGLRQVFNVETEGVLLWVNNHFTDHSQTLPQAINRANERAWDALGLALGGEGLIGRLKGYWAGGDVTAVRDQLRSFLEQTPSGLSSTPVDVRGRCLDELQKLRKAGRLGIEKMSPPELTARLASMQRFSNPSDLTLAAHQVLGSMAEVIAPEAPNLAVLLRQPCTPGGPPLLAGAFAFFFRRELEQNEELAHGLTFDTLRQLTAAQERGFAGLEATLGDRFGQLIDALADLKAELLDELRQFIADNHVRTSSAVGPPVVSVTDERELTRLRKLRDRLREVPPELLSADDWLLMGDGSTAAADFINARQEHQRAVAAAQATRNLAREAEASYKLFRAACEQADWDVALPALCRASELERARYEPFPLRRYELVRILGAGGFGTVFLCRDRYAKQREVAIKVLHTGDLARDLDEVFAEAQTLAELNHPGLIRVSQWDFADPDQQRPYLVMEYFAGSSLAEHLQQHGPLGIDDVQCVAQQIAGSLHAAHQAGVLHRDLKPANILIRKNEVHGWQIKVIDFGLAVRQATVQTSMVAASEQRTKRERSFAGTYDYAAPEQMGKLPRAKIGPHSDVYAFGKTCFVSLFRTTEPRSRQLKSLPPAFGELLEACVEQELEHRLPDFGEVLRRLDPTVGQSTPVVAPPPPTPTPPAAPVIPRPTPSVQGLPPLPITLPPPAPLAPPVVEVQPQQQPPKSLQEEPLPLHLNVDPPTLDPVALIELFQAPQPVPSHTKRTPPEPPAVEPTPAPPAATGNILSNLFGKFISKTGSTSRTQKPQERKRTPGEIFTLTFTATEAVKFAYLAGRGNAPMRQLPTTTSMEIKFAWIPPGAFWMGGRDLQDEQPLHRVTLSKGFYLGIYPVTQAQWRGVMGNNPSHFVDDNRPVETVSWTRCQVFCDRLRKLTGQAIRLPTEAEWEYACRAGSPNDPKQMQRRENQSNRGWFSANTRETVRVGMKTANAWGLYDMEGNVWEWCSDYFGRYSGDNELDPTGPARGERRVMRGGSWSGAAPLCTAAYRGTNLESAQANNFGVRVCFFPE